MGNEDLFILLLNTLLGCKKLKKFISIINH